MLKTIIIAGWGIAVAAVLSYMGIVLGDRIEHKNTKGESLKKIKIQSAPSITIPMIVDDKIVGYQLLRLSFSKIEEEIKYPIPLDVIVVDEAFSSLFANLERLRKREKELDLKEFREGLLERIHQRAGGKRVKEIFIQEFNFVDMGMLK